MEGFVVFIRPLRRRSSAAPPPPPSLTAAFADEWTEVNCITGWAVRPTWTVSDADNTNYKVTLEYSPDASGNNWFLIDDNLPCASGNYVDSGIVFGDPLTGSTVEVRRYRIRIVQRALPVTQDERITTPVSTEYGFCA